MDTWVIWTESTKAIVQESQIREKIKVSAQQWWIKPIDITSDMLRDKMIPNIQDVMRVVRKLICEYYGIWMWELMWNSKEFLMNKYLIPEEKLNTLYEWNVALAYQEFAKHNNWDNTWLQNKETPDAPLPTTTNVVTLPEEVVQKEEYKMLMINKQNLQRMMDTETDKEKLELYEAQMKVLDIKIKNAEA